MQESCTGCGRSLRPDAQWCGMCFTPRQRPTSSLGVLRDDIRSGSGPGRTDTKTVGLLFAKLFLTALISLTMAVLWWNMGILDHYIFGPVVGGIGYVLLRLLWRDHPAFQKRGL